MQNKGVNSLKSETLFATVFNQEASTTIGAGEPCCFNYNGTYDGCGVVTATTGTATKATSLFAGIATKAIAAGTQGITQRLGANLYTKVLRMTRAATTDIWASYVALAVGDILVVDTVNNALSRSAAGAGSGFLGFAMVAQTAVSATTQASSAVSTASSATALFSYIKTHLRTL